MARHAERLYFVQATTDGPIKIGRSAHLGQRLFMLSQQVQVPIRLLGTLPGGSMAELLWHDRFAATRFAGEWFLPTPALLTAIRKALAAEPREAVPA